MELAEWDKDVEGTSHEVSYNHKGGALRIEVHKDLFDTESSAYKGMNEAFSQAFDHSIQMEIDGVKIRTLDYSEHLLFFDFPCI